jgi:MFS family permease
MPFESSHSTRDLRRAWIIVAMLFMFMVINFADKAVIGLTAVPIIHDLHLTNEEFGAVGSAFFFLFSISGILGGFLANRISSKLLLTGMALVWSITQLPMLGTVSLPLLTTSRIVLGAGEGPAYPIAMHAIYKWFPNERRTFPSSFLSIGGAIGTGVVAPLLTWIILTFDWHAAFGFLGICGLIWGALWIAVGKEGPLDVDTAEAGADGVAHVPYLTLLTSRTTIGVALAGFAGYWALTLAVVWLPSFLIKAAGFTATKTGWIVVLPSLMQMFLSPAIGFVSDRLRMRGVTSRVSRGIITGSCVLIAGLAMVLLSRSSHELLEVPLVMVTFSVGAAVFTLGPPLIGEISPVKQRGAMLGITNGLYSLAGLAAPWFMGHLVDVGANPAAGFRDGFFFAGIIIACGGALSLLLIDPEADLARFRKRRIATTAFLRANLETVE